MADLGEKRLCSPGIETVIVEKMVEPRVKGRPSLADTAPTALLSGCCQGGLAFPETAVIGSAAPTFCLCGNQMVMRIKNKTRLTTGRG